MKKKLKKKKTKVNISRETLEAFSEDELAELILVAEETTRQNRPEVTYVANRIQKQFHKSDAFIRALFSGNGVGKTTACIMEGIWTATGTHPYRETSRIPNTTIIVLDDPSKADTLYLHDIRKYHWYDASKLKTEKHGRSYTVEVIFPNGSNWIFMTHDMGVDRWESIQCAGVIFDEPPPRFIFAALIRGMREKNVKPWMAFAGTPRGRNAPWMYRELYRPWKFHEDEEIECFGGTTYDNLHNLDSDTIKRWEKRYTKEELQVRVYGEFEFLSGRIFDTFYFEEHVEAPFPWPYGWPVILCIDPHLRKPHVGILIGVDPDKELHVIRELETTLSGRKAAEFFIRACEGFPIRYGICDNFGSMPRTGGEDKKSFIDVFNETAIRLHSRIRVRPTTNAEKKDDEWIEDMKDWLRIELDYAGNERAKFHIFDICVKTIDNFESYIWDEHKGAAADGKDVKEKPLGVDCDYLMCVKYGIATKPERIGLSKVYHRFMLNKHGLAREYESQGLKKDWMKE